jgi:CHAT domain
MLREHLQRSEAGFGLVFLACHGIIGEDIRMSALGSQTDASQRWRMLEMRTMQLRLLRASRCIVFINACHSGRLKTDEKYLRDGFRRGFAERFLAKGAHGVMGTLGAVGDVYAGRIARDLLDAALQAPEVPLATHLSRLRADVVVKLRNADALPGTDENRPIKQDLLLLFIYTFMYVYYGSPCTLLRMER